MCDLFRRYLCYAAELNFFYGNKFNCLYEYGSLLTFCVINKKALPYAVLLSSSELFLASIMENSTKACTISYNLNYISLFHLIVFNVF